MSVADYVCESCRRNADKSRWGVGPWQEEPDRFQWEHAGFTCLAHRAPHGAWCGYVGLPPAHPCYGQDYDDVADVQVHGGLTYAAHCRGHVCHDPKPGECDHLFWLGFDCAHAGDRCPTSGSEMGWYGDGMGEHYWTLAEVQAETSHLAEQLAAIARQQ